MVIQVPQSLKNSSSNMIKSWSAIAAIGTSSEGNISTAPPVSSKSNATDLPAVGTTEITNTDHSSATDNDNNNNNNATNSSKVAVDQNAESSKEKHSSNVTSNVPTPTCISESGTVAKKNPWKAKCVQYNDIVMEKVITICDPQSAPTPAESKYIKAVPSTSSSSVVSQQKDEEDVQQKQDLHEEEIKDASTNKAASSIDKNIKVTAASTEGSENQKNFTNNGKNSKLVRDNNNTKMNHSNKQTNSTNSNKSKGGHHHHATFVKRKQHNGGKIASNSHPKQCAPLQNSDEPKSPSSTNATTNAWKQMKKNHHTPNAKHIENNTRHRNNAKKTASEPTSNNKSNAHAKTSTQHKNNIPSKKKQENNSKRNKNKQHKINKQRPNMNLTQKQKEQVKPTVMQQIEYFFSATELARNAFLRRYMDVQGYIPAAIVLNFPSVVSFGLSYYELLDAIQSLSRKIEVDLVNECLRIKCTKCNGIECDSCQCDNKKWLYPNDDGTFGCPRWIKEIPVTETETADIDTAPDGTMELNNVTEKVVECDETSEEHVTTSPNETVATSVMKDSSIDSSSKGSNDTRGMPDLAMTDSDTENTECDDR